MGLAGGTAEGLQYTIPINGDVDKGQKRTSQRAELLAAINGVLFMARADELNDSPTGDAMESMNYGPRDSRKAWVIATDSEYVVKGITDWLPAWKVMT